MNSKPLKIALLTFTCIFLFISASNAQDLYDQKHIEVSLRMIGHQVLLNSKDSTSRVLPIVKDNGQYKIKFDTEFEFEPEELVETVNRVVRKTEIATSYIVEVEACETRKIVYSYEMANIADKDIIACKSRALPKACYSLLFTLAGTKRPMNFTLEDIPSKEIEAEKSQTNYMTILLVLFALMGIGSVSFFFWKRKKKTILDPNLIPLGEYHFDKHNTELLYNHQRIELTSKEADLLLLLYNAANTTVEREVMLNVVWGDKGDYVGRTLDVFISKLRKKLEADSNVKIVNTRGVGYKLVLAV